MERTLLTCPCDKKTQEIGTTNDVPSDFLPIIGLDMTEKIDIDYNDTENTRMPNDFLDRVDGEPYPSEPHQHIPQEPYGDEPPHEPYLSEYYPQLDVELQLNESLSIPSSLSTQGVSGSNPYKGDNTNWLGTASKINSEPSIHNEEGWAGKADAPMNYQNENPNVNDRIYNFPPQYMQETESKMATYVRYPHTNDVLCEAFDGKTIDLSIDSFRPIPPSEDSQFTNTSVNCKCYWVVHEKTEPDIKEEPQPKDEITGKFVKAPDPHDPYHETADFESKHPRAKDGRFGDIAGESGSSDKDTPKDKKPDNQTLTPDDNQKIEKGLKKHFGTVKEPQDIGKNFLTSDGEWVQLVDGQEHWSVLPAITDKAVSTDKARNLPFEAYLSQGIVRGGFEKGVVFVNSSIPLNSKQINALELTMIKKGLTTDNLVTEFPDDSMEKQLIHKLKKSFGETVQEGILVQPSTVSRYGKYTRTEHEHDDICASFEGKTYDLAQKSRPVPPSEGKGYTNTHPNCKCYYEPVENPEEETKKLAVSTKLDVLNSIEKNHIFSVHRKIGQRARNHKLHTVFEDGHLSKRTRGTNPMKEIKEALVELHGQFNWFTDDYLHKIGELDKSIGGKFILVRASAETITDHRAEGEPYRRLLKGEELMQLTRTGIGKSTDINHLGKEFEVDSQVLDAEYDPIRKESQMLVHLKDPEIIHFIETGQISSVSINAGAPRRMDTECGTGECFVVPTGLILGELDGIAFTWVVNDPAGIVHRGRYIPKATAGVKSTKIEIID